MHIIIEREKLKELLDKGIRKYYINKRRYGKNRMVDSIISEIETFVAFDSPDGFIGEHAKKEGYEKCI